MLSGIVLLDSMRLGIFHVLIFIFRWSHAGHATNGRKVTCIMPLGKLRTWLFHILFLLMFYQASGQDFAGQYRQLDSLYQAGDMAGCLQLENSILGLIGQRQDTLVANTYFYIGDAYRAEYETDKALTYFETEKALRENLLPLDAAGYSNTLFNLMYTYFLNGNFRNAMNSGEALLAYDQATYGINSKQYVYSLGDFVDVLLENDHIKEAEVLLNRALKSLPRKSHYEALILAKLGYVYSFTGLYSRSTRCFTEALPILQQHYGDTSPEYQLTMSNYGNLLMQQGKYDKAEELIATSLETIQASDWPDKEQLYYAGLNNLTLAHQMLGQFAAAESSFNRILRSDSATLGATHPEFATTLSNLGILYTDEKKFTESERVLRQAIEILRNSQDTVSLSFAKKLNNLARNFQQANQPEPAIPMLQQALMIFKTQLGKKSPEYATALFNLGTAMLATDAKAGYGYLKEAAGLRLKVLGKKHPLYAEVLEKLAIYHWKIKNNREADRHFGSVFQNYFNQVADFFPVLTEEEKSNLFFNTIRPSQELYASWATSEAAQQPAILGDLYSITLNTKGLILYATDRVKQKIFQSGDSTLINLYETWEMQKELLAFYYSSNQNPERVDSLLEVSKNNEKELSRKSAAFSRDIIRPHRKWNEIQAALKPGEAAIEIIRFRKYNIDSLKNGPEVHYAFLLLTSATKDGPRLVLLNEGTLLESRYLSYYRNGIQFKVDDEYTYGYFWQKVHDELKALGINKLYLSTDGAYNLLSLGSIKNPATQKYLLEEMDIHLVGSTRDLLSPRPTRSIGQSSMLIGYPLYNFRQEDGTNPLLNVEAKVVSRSIRGSLSRFLRGTNGIAELPGTKKEVELISKALSKKHDPILLIESMATEQNLKNAASPDILHIATHGYFLEDDAVHKTPNPLLNSGLILAGATNFIRNGHNPLHAEDDGVLTAYEAMNLNLENTNVVVLSACETGLGTVQNGEGVYGLQRAFQLAGANYIIMSLWPVDDEATQYLMTGFYRHWSETEDVREAFKLAQLETKAKFNASYYWGAFILIGSLP